MPRLGVGLVVLLAVVAGCKKTEAPQVEVKPDPPPVARPKGKLPTNEVALAQVRAVLPKHGVAELRNERRLTKSPYVQVSFNEPGPSDADLEALVNDLTPVPADVYLDLSKTGRRISPGGLAHLKGAAHVKGLRLHPAIAFKPSLEVIGMLTQLGELDLSDSFGMTNDDLARFAMLTNLQYLLFQDNQVSEDGLIHLQGLTNLREISCSFALSDKGLAFLKHLSKLERIGFIGNETTSTGMAYLKGLTGLHELKIGAKIGDADLEPVRGMHELRDFSITRADISGAGLAPPRRPRQARAHQRHRMPQRLGRGASPPEGPD